MSIRRFNERVIDSVLKWRFFFPPSVTWPLCVQLLMIKKKNDRSISLYR